MEMELLSFCVLKYHPDYLTFHIIFPFVICFAGKICAFPVYSQLTVLKFIRHCSFGLHCSHKYVSKE